MQIKIVYNKKKTPERQLGENFFSTRYFVGGKIDN